MNIVLGIAGSIAAWKAADISSRLIKAGHDVHCIMTHHACEFITPLTMSTMTRRPVLVSLEDEKNTSKPGHIELADHAELFLVAPCSANVLAQMAHGLAQDSLGSTYLALPRHTPVAIAPAMNGKMWLHPATQRNVEILRGDGVQIIGPASGDLACGYQGIGRMSEVAEILASLKHVLG